MWVVLQRFIIKSGWGEEKFKKVGLSKEQAKFEKEDVEKVEDGRYRKIEGK